MFKHIKNESKKFVVESYKTLNYYHEDLTFVMKYILYKPYKNLTGHDKKKTMVCLFSLYITKVDITRLSCIEVFCYLLSNSYRICKAFIYNHTKRFLL